MGETDAKLGQHIKGTHNYDMVDYLGKLVNPKIRYVVVLGPLSVLPKFGVPVTCGSGAVPCRADRDFPWTPVWSVEDLEQCHVKLTKICVCTRKCTIKMSLRKVGYACIEPELYVMT